MSSDRGLKRPSNEGNSFQNKKVRQECKFGAKCYRKNPSHFQEFDHSHLNDLLRRLRDDQTLPEDIDPELKKAPGIVLDQLKIIKGLRNSSNGSFEKEKPSTSQNVSPKPSFQPQDIPSNRNSPALQRNSKQKDDLGRQGGTSTSSVDMPNSSEMSKMIHEATKHHGDVQAKLDAAAPYHFFLTAVSDSPQTQNEHLTITFTELLDKSLGELESSLQINFMVEMGWLLAQYFFTGNRFKPMTLLYGVEDEVLQDTKRIPSNVTAVKIKPPTAFGHHHTKMSVLAYKDNSIRIIVSTANLVESDWQNRTQGLWVSPKLPQLPHDADTSSGESSTQFRADLLRYLSAYRVPQLQEWLTRIRQADFSSVKVFLVASVPGTHYGPELHLWGHRRLSSLLKSHVSDPKDPRCAWSKWPIVGQFSSIGSLGEDANSWVCGELKASMSAPSKPLEQPAIKLIYPSFENVKGSHDGLLGGACLPYQRKTHQKQQWLTNYLHQWQSNNRYRTHAMPHIKSYARVSPCHSFLSWFLLTSANLSKAAWGSETKTKLPGQGLRVLSYEAGVLFIPQIVVNDCVFNLENKSNSAALSQVSLGNENRQEYPPFPLHYDLPLKAYKSGDSPWFYDILLET